MDGGVHRQNQFFSKSRSKIFISVNKTDKPGFPLEPHKRIVNFNCETKPSSDDTEKITPNVASCVENFIINFILYEPNKRFHQY